MEAVRPYNLRRWISRFAVGLRGWERFLTLAWRIQNDALRISKAGQRAATPRRGLLALLRHLRPPPDVDVKWEKYLKFRIESEVFT